MIPEIEPVNIWTGNNSTTEFDFDFLINSESELTVIHKDKDGNITILEANIDYTINQIGNENGGTITFPIQGSQFEVLQEDEIITLVLDLPIAQTSPYGTSQQLNLKSLEHSLDYITRLIQILNRVLERCVKVEEGSNLPPNGVIDDLMEVEERAIVYVEQAKEQVLLATEKTEEAIQYRDETAELLESAQNALEYGYTPLNFTSEDWLQVDGLYELTLEDVPFINGVYRKNEDNSYERVININQIETDSETKLIAQAPFDGYALKTAQVHIYTVFDQDAESDVWSITHNQRRYPCVTCMDTGGTVILGSITYTSLNALEIHFENPVSGKAILN